MSLKTNYDHQRIEAKWQKYWEDFQTFRSEVDLTRPKYYILDMFPYPSGAGLHVGHVTGYTATDILARYKRLKGFNVLHPMGWDSFGLPAEQYAIRTGTHPRITTEKNIDTYRRQLKSLGFSYDWGREIATSDPTYYKWTQWIFTKLYEKGLAYEAEALVNFCPALGTVLANEEVDNGVSKEGGFAVERRPLRQWILKITAYADRLLEDLELIDWPESLKKLQINWIGRSQGAQIRFEEKKTGESVWVFTTRADTLFGVSYVVLAPEHPLVAKVTAEERLAAVEEYRQRVASKSDLERTDLNKEKTGVWTGAYVRNPADGRQVPVWVSDYVLMTYGTGAVMAVPSHDERDFAFAKKYGLSVLPILEPSCDEVEIREEVAKGMRCWTGEGTHTSLELRGLDLAAAKEKMIQWLEKTGQGKGVVQYKLRDWLFSRQRYWGEPFPILHFADGTKRVLEMDELPLMPPEMSDFKPSPAGDSPLARDKRWVEIIDPKTGKKALRETNTMPQWAGSCWYYLRFCDPHATDAAWGAQAEQYWMPVDLYVGGVEHAVLHLLYARFWHKVLFDCGLVSTAEPFQTLRNQGLLVARSYQHSCGGYVPPEEVYEKEGAFFQLGTDERLSSQVEKMSKSKLNGVTPDQMLDEFGADALRLYEMFMGPFDKEKVWNTEAVSGCRRFLGRVYEMIFSDKASDEESEEALRLGHRLVHAVEKDIEGMQFNTAIAKMMEFLNDFLSLPQYPKSVLKMFALILSPFAPHIAEEAWEHLGGQGGISYHPFPIVNPAYLVDDTVLYVVQVNGKTRGKWLLPKDTTEAELLEFIQKQPPIARHLTGPVTKVVHVPNKLVSLVCSSP